jgi:hypothetical protein
MAFSTDNIGKNCYINMSEDENVEDSLYGTIIGYYKDTDKNEEYYFVSINGNVKRIYDDSLINIVEDGGGGSGSITPGSIVTATGQMTSQQAATTRENLGAEPEKFVVTVSDDGQGNLSANKTFAEISIAYKAGETIVALYKRQICPLTFASIELLPCFRFEVITTTGNYGIISYSQLSVYSIFGGNDSWEMTGPIEFGNSITTETQSSVSITPIDKGVYTCTAAALTSLTITNPPATGEYSIVFTSGATPTTTTFPSAILGLEDFAAEANTVYEINVLDNRAVVGSWAVTQ